MDFVQAAARLRPGTAWNYDEARGLVQAEDKAERVKPPTMEEIKACIAGDPLAYQEKRANAYPCVGDQLDAIWKVIAALQQELSLPKDVAEMLAKIQAVKEKFPSSIKGV